MFEIGKKGSDKGQPAAEQPHQAAPTASEPARRAPSASREPAVIGPSIRIDGDVRGEENLLIEGEVKGTVHLKDNSLVIGSQGRVKANVYAQSIEVEGLMEGDLYASDRINVRKSAQVRGNITAPRVSLEDGAQFKGSIEMDAQAVEAALGKNRSGNSVASLNGGKTGSQPGKPGAEANPPGSAAAAKQH
ncbi:MAG: polymer-forming cytoskeletal protein [Gammaproteobacteria bacterium]|nr:polymer-forming cytoskeletal protein [Gammaproteobacteria bacterium]